MTEKKHWSDIVSSFSAAIAAIAAFFTVYQSASSYKSQSEASRPYFMSADQGFKADTNSVSLPTLPPTRIMISLKNIGLRPARGLHQTIITTNISLHGDKLQLDDSYTPYNEIAPSESFTTHMDAAVDFKKGDIQAQYFVIAIRYEDPITEKPYHQTFVWKWLGVTEGKYFREWAFATEQEAQRVLLYMKGELKDYTPKK